MTTEELGGRTLTSAWIETGPAETGAAGAEVALSRVRGLKLFSGNGFCKAPSRTLTSAWIETGQLPDYPARERVALSRVRGLKLLVFVAQVLTTKSHSHECVD